MKHAKPEYYLQCMIVDYLDSLNPIPLYKADIGGMRISMWQAIKAKNSRHKKGILDLQIIKERIIENELGNCFMGGCFNCCYNVEVKENNIYHHQRHCGECCKSPAQVGIGKKTKFLFIEIKTKSGEIYTHCGKSILCEKTGVPSKEQLWWNKELNERGYKAVICYGWKETKKVIDDYLGVNNDKKY